MVEWLGTARGGSSPLSYFMGRTNKYTHNQEYFSIPDEQNSYWAGFIGADGCIYKPKTGSYRLEVKLNTGDILHLETFKNEVKYTGTIHNSIQKSSRPNRNNTYLSSVYITSNDICKNLLNNFNIGPRKTFTLKPPNLIKRKDILSYIIGYIDGDGNIAQNTGKYLKIRILGTKELLEWINKQFNNIGTISQPDMYKNNTYLLQYFGQNCRNILKECKEHIKKHNLKVLNRKWNKVTEEKLK